LMADGSRADRLTGAKQRLSTGSGRTDDRTEEG
jgi:hypothetical protein